MIYWIAAFVIFVLLRLIPSDKLRSPEVYICWLINFIGNKIYIVSGWISYIIPDQRKHRANNPRNIWRL